MLLNPSLVAAWDWRAALLHNPARPVVNLSFAFDRAISGFSSFGFHVTNVVLHIAVVGLFFGWCTRALTDAGSGERSDGEPSVTPAWGAFFAAAALALHPAMSQAVDYVSARSELLAAIGTLAALTYARRAIVTGSKTAGWLAVLFGAVAIGSSSSAAALPLLVLAYDAWVLRDPGWGLRAARVYAPAMLGVGIAAAWYLTGIDARVVPPRGPIENLLTEAVVAWRYVALLVAPTGQSVVHQVRWIAGPFDPIGLAALLALAAAVTFAVMTRRRRPLLAFGVVCFAGVLAPTTSFIPVRDAMAEHRLYLASTGLLLAAVSLVPQTIAGSRVVRAALAGVLAVLALTTYRRNEIWSEPVTLWEEAVRRSPEAWQAHWGYGELLRETGRCDRALPEYEAVLRLYPGHGGALDRLSMCRGRVGATAATGRPNNNYVIAATELTPPAGRSKRFP